MKKRILVLMVLLLMIIPVSGCLQDDITASSLVPRIKTIEDNQTKQESKISSLETNRVTQADLDASLTNSKAYTDAKFSSVSSTNYSSQISTLETKIAALESKISALETKINSSTTTSTSSSGTSTVSNGFNISLEKNSFYTMATGTSPNTITMTITNTSGTGKNCTPYLRFNAQSPTAYEKSKVTQFDVKSNISGSIVTTTGVVQSMQDITTLTNQIVWVLPSFWLDNNASKTVWLEFTTKTTDMVTWKLDAMSF